MTERRIAQRRATGTLWDPHARRLNDRRKDQRGIVVEAGSTPVVPHHQSEPQPAGAAAKDVGNLAHNAARSDQYLESLMDGKCPNCGTAWDDVCYAFDGPHCGFESPSAQVRRKEQVEGCAPMFPPSASEGDQPKGGDVNNDANNSDAGTVAAADAITGAAHPQNADLPLTLELKIARNWAQDYTPSNRTITGKMGMLALAFLYQREEIAALRETVEKARRLGFTEPFDGALDE